MAMAMKGAMGVALAMLIAFSIVLTVVAEGECNADHTCPDSNNCCSKWNFCGTGDAYCGDGCTGGPCNQHALPSVGGGCSANSPCSNSNDCCSKWGFCGTGGDYCGDGCQAGPCYAQALPSVGGGCSANSPCSNSNDCCSKWGFCGTGGDYCGDGCQAGPCYAQALPSVGGGCSANSPCSNSNDCCSKWGFCGTGGDYCGDGCQAGPCYAQALPSVGAGLGDTLTRNLYEQLFPGHLPFYNYDKLIEAAKSFPQFGTTGDSNTRKREIAAFAAHVQQETSGLKKIVEQTNDPYCDNKRPEFPCNGKHFNGRGPLQLSWNYNYGTCGKYLKLNLLGNPDLVATDPLISFKSSLWFWNQYGDNRIPHIHDVITGNWKPSSADKAANRLPGFGVTIVIINGNLECGKQTPQADNRVKYFKEYCSKLNVSPGDNLDCKKMKPFYGVDLLAEA